MNSLTSWRAGAGLVLLGGVVATIGWAATGLVPDVARLGIVGDLAVGLGLILAGVGIRRRYPACWLLMVAGGGWLLEGLVLAAAVVVVMPRWAISGVLVIVAATTVAAVIGMIMRGRVTGMARWVLVLPALATTAMALGWGAGIPAGWGALIPWIVGASSVTPLLVGMVWLLVRDDARVEPSPVLASA